MNLWLMEERALNAMQPRESTLIQFKKHTFMLSLFHLISFSIIVACLQTALCELILRKLEALYSLDDMMSSFTWKLFINFLLIIETSWKYILLSLNVFKKDKALIIMKKKSFIMHTTLHNKCKRIKSEKMGW